MTAGPGGPAPPVGRQPRRLSPWTPVVRAPIVLLAALGASWRQLLEQDDIGMVGILLLALLVLGAAYGAASWLRTRYWIDGDELRIDTGVVVRQSRRIRIDRVQGIDIVQPLVARAFGLAELRFDAAGGEREGRLAFLPHAEALAVRRSLLRRRDDLTGLAEPSGPDAAEAPETVLARLDLGRLLVSLALSTEAVVGVAVGLGTLAVALGTGTFAVAGILLPAALGLALSVARRLTAYYGFVLAESPAGLHVRRGLTSLSSQTVAPARIQGVVVSEPLLWRPLGWARLEVSVAGKQVADADSLVESSTLLPVAPREEVLALARHILAGHDLRAVPLSTPPRRAAWRAPLTSWNLAAGADDALAVSRRGWWVRRVDAVPHQRVQSVRVTQGPVQGWLRLASVHVDSPPGPVRVRGLHCDPATAATLARELVRRAREARRAPQGAALSVQAQSVQAQSVRAQSIQRESRVEPAAESTQ